VTQPPTAASGAPTRDGEASLRAERRARVFAAMGDAGLDVVVLGRRDDVAYATGARALWTAGTRPFGPAAVLVGATRATHLLTTWDAGVPPEIPFEDLYGVTWNPAVMARALGGIPGLADARRVGVDAWSPGFARAAGRLAPSADLVAVDDVMRAVRAVKLPAEIDRITAACAAARAGVTAVARALRDVPGDVVAARAAAWRALAAAGAVVPTSGVVVEVAGDSVHVDVGVLADGYEGAAGRTLAPDGSTTGVGTGGSTPAGAVQRLVLAAVQPGATGADLAVAAAAAGADDWRVRGSGMGHEQPVIDGERGAGARLEAGMVLSVAVAAAGDRRRDLAVVPPSGAAQLL
jgi:Xaa-Pro aminopeptidase